MRFAAVMRAFVCGVGPGAAVPSAVLGDWLRLYVAAVADEVESDTIPGAASWDDSRWQRFACIGRDSVDAIVSAELARWKGSDLVVLGYDHGGERRVKTLRDNWKFGKLGGRPRNDKQITHKGYGSETLTGSQPITPYPIRTVPIRSEKASPSSAEPVVTDVSAPVDRIPLANGSTWVLTEDHLERLTRACPGIDPKREAAKAAVWCETNPRKRKTEKGVANFLRAWFEKAQNDAGRNAIAPQNANGAARNSVQRDIRVGHASGEGMVHGQGHIKL